MFKRKNQRKHNTRSASPNHPRTSRINRKPRYFRNDRSNSHDNSSSESKKQTSHPDFKLKAKPRVKHVSQQENRRYHIMGIRPIEEAMRKGVKLSRLYLQKQEKRNFDQFIDYCKSRKINFFFIEKQELDEKAAGHNHQGVIAELLKETRIIPNLKEYLDKNLNPDHNDVVLILDRITDQQNVGAIARSAYFFGCRLIISERSHSAPIDSVVHKTSSGASLMVSFHLSNKMTETIETLKEAGYKVLAATSQDAIPLNQLNQKDSANNSTHSPKHYVVILGSEDKGIRPHLERLADHRITIPRLNDFDSLNVSVATGIILYAMRESGMIE